MKIALISDLHMEFRQSVLPILTEPVDVLVLAGDIANYKKVVEVGLSVANGYARYVIFVAGNHEFYSGRYDKAIARIEADVARHNTEKESLYPFVYFLNDSAASVDGWMFVGGTLWTDYRLQGNEYLDMLRAESYMNDHRTIKWKENETTYGRFKPKNAQRLHFKTKAFLFEQLSEQNQLNNLDKTVVVTHHAPSFYSVNEKYHGPNELNSAYASDLTSLMDPVGPAYWFHGHMHDPVDYKLTNTRVIANPRGYPGERANPEIRFIEL